MCNRKTPLKKTEEKVTPFLRRRVLKKKDTRIFNTFKLRARVVNVGVVLRVIFPLLSFIYFLLLKTHEAVVLTKRFSFTRSLVVVEL